MLGLDHQLFLLLNADADAPGWLVASACFMAAHAQWLLLPLALGLALHHARAQALRPLAAAVLAIAIGSLACMLIGMLWDRPRPFELGLGHLHLPHSGSPSFPSSHATAFAALAFSFLLVAEYRAIGAILLVLAGLVGVARVVVGVHYPLDIAGGVVIGGLAAMAAHRLIDRLAGPRPAVRSA